MKLPNFKLALFRNPNTFCPACPFDISIKSFGIATLKLTAVILVTDAVVFLLRDFLNWIGAFESYSSFWCRG